jgi:hypothetical protein
MTLGMPWSASERRHQLAGQRSMQSGLQHSMSLSACACWCDGTTPHSHLLHAPPDHAALCCACCRAALRILGEDKAMVERLRPEALPQEYSARADLPQIAFR